MRDWRAMTAGEFDSRAVESVQMALLPVPDPCGTGDLLGELEEVSPGDD